MYKLTFMDEDTAAFVSSTVSVFADDLDEFEKNWMVLQRDEETKKRYLSSKAGVPTTDFFPTDHDEDLEVVQTDPDQQIIKESEVSFENISVGAENAYDCIAPILFEHLQVRLRYIFFQGSYWKLASFSGKGVCRDDEDLADLLLGERYVRIKAFGNPFLVCRTKSGVYSSTDPCQFSGDEVSSFVWYGLRCYPSKGDMDADTGTLSQEELMYLLRDIVGEAG